MLRRPYRVGALTWFARLMCLGGAAFAALLLAAFLFGDDGNTTVGDRIGGIAFVTLFIGPWLLAVWRFTRIGVYVDDQGVVVKRFLRTERYGWSEIVGIDTVLVTASDLPRLLRFTYATNPLARDATCLRLRLTDRRERRIVEVNSSVPTWFGTKPAAVAALVAAARPSA